MTFGFDPPQGEDATEFEAHAAEGDSGGAAFVRRDGEWKLVGMMASISAGRASPTRTSEYGDVTYAADISHYRGEIFRWTRGHCANEKDDDGDGKIDFPLDPDCDSSTDRDERDLRPLAIQNAWMIGLICLGGAGIWRFRVRAKANS